MRGSSLLLVERHDDHSNILLRRLTGARHHAIVLSSRDIAAARGKATHVVAIFSTDAHAFTEGKDDKTS